MKIGVATAFNKYSTPETMVRTAKIVEDAGLHSLWVPEHVVFFERHESRYPYSEDGRIPGNPDGLIDPFSALAFIAGHTQRIRLGTAICLVPQRNPIYTARQVADVDFLSEGAFRLRRGGRLAEGGVCLPWSAMGAQGRSHRRLHRGDEGAVDNRRGHSPRRVRAVRSVSATSKARAATASTHFLRR